MSQPRIVFDLDDTLYPERQFALSGFRAAARWAEREFGVAGLDVEMVRLLDQGMLGAMFKHLLERHVPHHTPAHVTQFLTAYRDCEPELSLFPDAAIALDHFSNRGPIGLITDGLHSVQARKVSALGIAPRFRHIVFTDTLGPGRAFFKPHPKAYEEMAAALDDPEGGPLIYVGDNAQKDFIAPNAMGWITVQVVRDGGIHDRDKMAPGGMPQHRIHSLTELMALVTR